MKAQADLESKNESTGRDCESCVVLEADHRKRVRESGSKRATSEVKKKSLRAFEIFVKLIARGIWAGPFYFFGDSWNWLDFSVTLFE